MSVADTQLFELIETYIGRLENSQDDVRRRATDEFYESIIAQYADVSFSSSFFKKLYFSFFLSYRHHPILFNM